VARPLNRMSRAARRIAGGDYQQRVPVNGPREVRTLAASFNDMAGRVALSQQAQRDFLANVSHDLRTPLTSIQGFSQAIAEGVTSDPEAAQRAAQVIHDEAARMHRMVESLLDLARIEAGQLDFQAHAVALSDLLQGIGDSLSVRAREKGLLLELDVPPGLPRIAGDGDRLAQVFTNLLDNAIKHTPAGGQITLQAETTSNGVTVTVQDTGVGVPPDDLPRIFERFYQVDKSRQSDRRSGMGLGLAITKQIVEAHGGVIQVTSAPGQGTTFTVWLPLPAPDMTTVAGRRPG
jgi:signal transduction histidine kinase